MTTLQISIGDTGLVEELKSYLKKLQAKSKFEILEFEEVDDTEYLSRDKNIRESIIKGLKTPLSECSKHIDL